MAEEFIPIILFIAIAIVICTFFLFRYRGRRDMQQTIRTAIEKGQELTPELIASLGKPRQPSKQQDLRLALIWLAVAAGICLFGMGMGRIEEEVFSIMLSISAFPAMLGLAYIIMWRFTERGQ